MQDSMTQLGEALQVMLTFPFPAEGLFFPWDVFSAACAIPVLEGPFFSAKEEILNLLMPRVNAMSYGNHGRNL